MTDIGHISPLRGMFADRATQPQTMLAEAQTLFREHLDSGAPLSADARAAGNRLLDDVSIIAERVAYEAAILAGQEEEDIDALDKRIDTIQQSLDETMKIASNLRPLFSGL